MKDPISVLNVVSAVWTLAGGLVVCFFNGLHTERLRRQRLRILKQAAQGGELAICLGAGGNSVPEPDVVRYLREQHGNIDTVMVYQAPAKARLDDPETALRILEDIREWICEYGQQEMRRIHFFPAGMVAYPFLVGAMLSNLCPVVVYHKLKTGGYIPLYEWNRDTMHQHKRATRALARWHPVHIDRSERAVAPESPALGPE